MAYSYNAPSAFSSTNGDNALNDNEQSSPRRRSIDESLTYVVTPENEHEFFRDVYGRNLNNIQPLYMLPADRDERRRYDHFHKLMYLVMGHRNYVGPVHELLSAPGLRKKQILDVGTGGGLWAMQMADEFPDVEVTGADLAPIQPRLVPMNLEFEIFDSQTIPYDDDTFDFVHARAVHTGIRDYPAFLREVSRVLRPGGMVILAEGEHKALTENKQPIVSGTRGGAPGWHALWEQYRKCLTHRGIDVNVPTKLRTMLAATGTFEDIVAQEALIPIGFWPKDPTMLTIGQFAWMDHDLFLPALRPLFLSYGLSEFRTDVLIEDAQKDLYQPLTRPYSCIHVTYARKRSF